MQFHFTKSPAAPVLPVPAVPTLSFAHQRGMYGDCKNITAYCGHEDIGGAWLDACTLTWFIGVQGVERTLKHDLTISLDGNLAAVDAIITEEFLRGRTARSARVAHNHEVVGSNPTPATSSRGGVGSRHAETTTRPKWVGGTAQVKSASEVTAPPQGGRVLDVGGANPSARKRSQGSDPSGFNTATAGVAPSPRETNASAVSE